MMFHGIGSRGGPFQHLGPLLQLGQPAQTLYIVPTSVQSTNLLIKVSLPVILWGSALYSGRNT